MNIIKSIPCTIALGFVIAVLVTLSIGTDQTGLNWYSLMVWLHVVFGVLWIGLLYYFNFVQVPAVGEITAGGGDASAINKHVAPRALLWFRWAALLTWITGVLTLEVMRLYMPGGISFVNAFTFNGGAEIKIIGTGAWLGTIMLFNVWVLIWPNQKKILGLVYASDEEKAQARTVALVASRVNTMLSIPMLMCMVGYGHNLPY